MNLRRPALAFALLFLVSLNSWAQPTMGTIADAVANRESAIEASLKSEDFIPLEAWTATLVTARYIPQLGDVRGISDVFTFEGRISAHVSFSAAPGKHAGRPRIEFRWINGDQTIAIRKATPLISRSPYYMANSISGTALGGGECKVELHVNGVLVATRGFQVVANQQ